MLSTPSRFSDFAPPTSVCALLQSLPARFLRRHQPLMRRPAALTASSRRTLCDALRNGASLEAVRVILQSDPLAARERFLLHAALEHGAHPAVLLLILAANVEAVRERNAAGDMPLHLALRYKASNDAVQIILNANPVAALESGGDGVVPLHLALRCRAPADIVQLLLGASPKEDVAVALQASLKQRAPTEVIVALLEAYPSAGLAQRATASIAEIFSQCGDLTGLSRVVCCGVTTLGSFDAVIATHKEWNTDTRAVMRAWHRGSLLWCRLLERSLAQRTGALSAQTIRTFLFGECGRGTPISPPFEPGGDSELQLDRASDDDAEPPSGMSEDLDDAHACFAYIRWSQRVQRRSSVAEILRAMEWARAEEKRILACEAGALNGPMMGVRGPR